jgi:hypothetical protein
LLRSERDRSFSTEHSSSAGNIFTNNINNYNINTINNTNTNININININNTINNTNTNTNKDQFSGGSGRRCTLHPKGRPQQPAAQPQPLAPEPEYPMPWNMQAKETASVFHITQVWSTVLGCACSHQASQCSGRQGLLH